MQPKIRVNVDLDDVLSDFVTYWMQVHYEYTGEQITPNKWDVSSLSIHGSRVYDYFSMKDFYYNSPVKVGAQTMIRYLEDNSETFSYKIVSSCKQEGNVFDYIYDQKYMWLSEHFSPEVAEKLILTDKSKKNFPCDIIIDDYVLNLVETNAKCVRMLMHCNHNRFVNIVEDIPLRNGVNIRVKTPEQVVTILRSIKDVGFDTFIKHKRNILII
jgi:hypothetical protein